MTDQKRIDVFLSKIEYMVLAVTLDDGSPWATPVKLQRRNKNVFEWDSKLDTLHSQAISRRPQIAITLYEKTNDAQFGVYMTGTAELVEERGHGLGRYRFTAEKAWINDETFQKRKVILS